MDINTVMEIISNFIREYNTLLLLLIIIVSIVTLILQILSYRIDLKYSKMLGVNMSDVDKKKLISMLPQIMSQDFQKDEKEKNVVNNIAFQNSNFDSQPQVGDTSIDNIMSTDTTIVDETENTYDYRSLSGEEVTIMTDSMLIPTLTSPIELPLIDGFRNILNSGKSPSEKVSTIKNIIKVAIKTIIKENNVAGENMFTALAYAILEYKNKNELIDLIDILDRVKVKYGDSVLPGIVDRLK